MNNETPRLTNPPDVDGVPVRHQCAASGCNVSLDPARLMCGSHWRLLPRGLQDKIYRAYRHRMRGEAGAEEEHLALCREAMAALR